MDVPAYSQGFFLFMFLHPTAMVDDKNKTILIIYSRICKITLRFSSLVKGMEVCSSQQDRW